MPTERPRNIVIGQKVPDDLADRAREFRRQMTPEERLLWRALKTNKLSGYHFRRQQVVVPYIVDFYCHSVGLVVEVDGSVHDQRTEADHERALYLSSLGLHIMRITNAEIHRDLPAVLDRIHAEIRGLVVTSDSNDT